MEHFISIKQYHQHLIEGKITCIDQVKFCLQNIEKNAHLNNFVEVFENEILIKAQEIDFQIKSERKLKKLSGVVVGLKDVICYKDHYCSASSKMLKEYKAIYQSTAVERLLNEGALIIGRQNCDEFAMGSTTENSYYGPCLNFVDPTKVAGGSSGGSANAVKAGMCMLSLGSDTGGSVRQPADFCGVIGFKPSYGRISRHGLIAYASSLEVIGLIGNYLDDIETCLSVVAGKDDFDHTAIQQPLSAENNQPKKLVYFKNWLELKELDPEIKNNFFNFLTLLKENGYIIEEFDFPNIDALVSVYYILATAEAASNLSRYDGIKYGYNTSIKNLTLNEFIIKNRTEGLGKEVKKRILLGNFVLGQEHFESYYAKAAKIRNFYQSFHQKILKNNLAVLAPTIPQTAFPLNYAKENSTAVYLADIYTVYANLVKAPAISLPLFKHSNGLPFGLQIIGNFNHDLTIIDFAKNINKIISYG